MAKFLVTYTDEGNCPIEEHTEEIESEDGLTGVINQLYEDTDDDGDEADKFSDDTHRITIERIKE